MLRIEKDKVGKIKGNASSNRQKGKRQEKWRRLLVREVSKVTNYEQSELVHVFHRSFQKHYGLYNIREPAHFAHGLSQ